MPTNSNKPIYSFVYFFDFVNYIVEKSHSFVNGSARVYKDKYDATKVSVTVVNKPQYAGSETKIKYIDKITLGQNKEKFVIHNFGMSEFDAWSIKFRQIKFDIVDGKRVLTEDAKFASEEYLSRHDWNFDARKLDAVDDVLTRSDLLGDGYKSNLKGDDVFHLGMGRDKFFSGDGNDKLFGDGQADKLDGGRGDDEVLGGLGNDHLTGGKGNDTLTGGKGKDKFHFAAKSDRDTIVDFENGRDTIVLNDNLWNGKLSARKVLKKFGEKVGGDYLLNFGGGDVLTIESAKKSHLIDDIAIA